jgi:hypothetical protein
VTLRGDRCEPNFEDDEYRYAFMAVVALVCT